MHVELYAATKEDVIHCIEYLCERFESQRGAGEKADTALIELCYAVAQAKGAFPHALTVNQELVMANAALILLRLEEASKYFFAMIVNPNATPFQQAYGTFAIAQIARARVGRGEMSWEDAQEDIACAESTLERFCDKFADGSPEWEMLKALYERQVLVRTGAGVVAH